MTAAYRRPLVFKGLQMARGEGGFLSEPAVLSSHGDRQGLPDFLSLLQTGDSDVAGSEARSQPLPSSSDAERLQGNN